MSRRIKDIPISPLLDKRKGGATITKARTIYEQLKEAAHLADVIEAAESGYVALDDQSIHALDEQLLTMIDRIREAQSKKISGAATPETDETH